MSKLTQPKAIAFSLVAIIGGLSAIALGTLATRATTPDLTSSPIRTLTSTEIRDVTSVIDNSPELQKLIGANAYNIRNFQPFRRAGVDTGGVAAELVFTAPVVFSGVWPTTYVDNSVTEDQMANGAQPPASLSIRYGSATLTATADRLFVIALRAKIVEVQPEPLAAPDPEKNPAKPIVTPATVTGEPARGGPVRGVRSAAPDLHWQAGRGWLRLEEKLRLFGVDEQRYLFL